MRFKLTPVPFWSVFLEGAALPQEVPVLRLNTAGAAYVDTGFAFT
jgi:hypothetical protein